MRRSGRGGNDQPHRRPPPPIRHRLLHRAEHVAGAVAADRHVGVAGDAEDGRGQDFVAGEDGRGVGGDNVVQPRQADAVRPPAALIQRENCVGDGQHDDPLRGTSPRRRCRQHRRHVPLLARQKRRRIEVLHGQRGQRRQDFLGEVRLEELPLLGRPILGARTARPCSANSASARFTPSAWSSIMRWARALMAVSCAAGVMPAGSRRRTFAARCAHQAGDADEKKLIQIRTDDGQELHPLQQRHVVGEPLAEHAVVELQPAQLAVDEQFRRF